MKKSTAILSFIIAGLIIGSCVQSDKRISLRFKYEPGIHLYYEQISKRSYKVIDADTVSKHGVSSYRVDIEQEFIRFIDDTTAEISESSTWEFERPSKEDSTKMEKHTSNLKTRLQVLPTGKVIGVEFVDDTEKNRISYIKNYYEQGVPVFPTGEKPVGYVWTQTTKVVLPEETMEASTTYEIKSLVRQSGYDCALIEYNGNMAIPLEPSPEDTILIGGLDRIKIKGLMYFAYKEGIVVDQKETWVIDGDRTKLKDNEAVNYKVEMEYGVTYRLVNREKES